MNESSRGADGPGGGDPPISGGFPSPSSIVLKEEFPASNTPPSTDLQALAAFGDTELGDLDRDLVGDGFTLSRLLGGDNPSPTAASWDTLNESMANTNTNGNGQASVNSNANFENANANSNDNNPSNPGYRPWEAEAASNHAMSTAQTQGRPMHPPPYYTAHHHAMVQHQHHHHLMQSHLPSFQSQFNFNENVPPPNTQVCSHINPSFPLPTFFFPGPRGSPGTYNSCESLPCHRREKLTVYQPRGTGVNFS